MTILVVNVDQSLPEGALDAFSYSVRIDEKRFLMLVGEHQIREIAHQFGVVSVEKF